MCTISMHRVKVAHLRSSDPDATSLRWPWTHKIEFRRIDAREITILQPSARKLESREAEMQQVQGIFGLHRK